MVCIQGFGLCCIGMSVHRGMAILQGWVCTARACLYFKEMSVLERGVSRGVTVLQGACK